MIFSILSFSVVGSCIVMAEMGKQLFEIMKHAKIARYTF